LVDVEPYESEEDPITSARKVIAELEKWGEGIDEKPRWLILNKIDILPDDEVEARCREIIEGLGWTGPVFRISALRGDGLQELTYRAMEFLEQDKADDAEQD
jgi:GTP-binding protein